MLSPKAWCIMLKSCEIERPTLGFEYFECKVSLILFSSLCSLHVAYLCDPSTTDFICFYVGKGNRRGCSQFPGL